MKRGLVLVVLATLLLSVSAPVAMADSGPGSMHIVRAGETLASIARRYCTTWQELHTLNSPPLANPDQLYPGMRLRIVNRCGGWDGDGGWLGDHEGPGEGHWGVYDRGPRPHAQGYLRGDSYTVVWGDTAYSIAQRFGVTVDGLRSANGINPWRIFAGQCLMIPGIGQGGHPWPEPRQPYEGQPHPSGPRPPRP